MTEIGPHIFVLVLQAETVTQCGGQAVPDQSGFQRMRPSSPWRFFCGAPPADFPSADFSDYNISPVVRGRYDRHKKIGALSCLHCAIGAPPFTDSAISRDLAA